MKSISIKGVDYELINDNGTVYYKDLFCSCGCGKRIPFNKWHVGGNKIAVSLKGHHKPRNSPRTRSPKIKGMIESGELLDIDGALYYANKFCKCGCGSNIRYGGREGFYVKGHWFKDPDFINKKITYCNSPEFKARNREAQLKRHALRREREEQQGYITVKGGAKREIEFIDGVKYYKGVFCKCGCGNQIKVTKSNVRSGKLNYCASHCLPELNSRKGIKNAKNNTIIENGVEYFKDAYCQCGCGERIPTYGKRNKRKYIKEHSTRLLRLLDSGEVIEINGEHFYKDIYCKCGCGNRIKYCIVAPTQYIGNHWLNDKKYMEKLRANTLNELSQKGSYGQVGEYYSAKTNTTLPYDSSYELRAMELLESDQSVSYYERCRIRIPYDYEDKTRNYCPDFLVNFANQTTILEVKPKKFVNSDKNVAKFSAARDYCSDNSLNFEVWTEKDLGLRKNGSYTKNKTSITATRVKGNQFGEAFYKALSKLKSMS